MSSRFGNIEVAFGKDFHVPRDLKAFANLHSLESKLAASSFASGGGDGLRNTPYVKKNINKFWLNLEKTSAGTVHKTVMIRLLLQLCQLLHQEMCYDEAIKLVNEDWHRDAKNSEALTYEQ